MKRNLMKRAHQIAKGLEGDYRARMSLALRIVWREGKGVEKTVNPEVIELISKFGLKLGHKNGKPGIRITEKVNQKQVDQIKALKDEIIGELQEREAAHRAAAEEREAKINAIEGLKELQKAISAEEDYHREFNRRMENEALSSFLPARPAVSSKDIRAKYPRAAAYIKAENWKWASNYAKSGAGEKALERIINGEDHEQVMADMESEWSAHCQERMWD